MSNKVYYSTIQDAIDSAKDGDVLIATQGTYAGRGNRDITFKGLGITLRSLYGALSTIIDVEGKSGHRGFIFDRNERPETARLIGFTIRNGNETNGGGILCSGDDDTVMGSPTIMDCIITGCHAKKKGGGILCASNSVPDIIRCQVLNNDAGHEGGGVAIEGPMQSIGEFGQPGQETPLLPRPRIQDCTVAGNKSGRNGGGVWVDRRALPQVLRCSIESNETLQSGGGLGCDGRSFPRLTECTVVSNVSRVDGGGLWFSGNSLPQVVKCVVSGNVAWRNGAGVYLLDSQVQVKVVGGVNPPPGVSPPPWASLPQFTGCSVMNNSVAARGGCGGGMYVEVTVAEEGGVIFNHGFIVNNRAPKGGGVCVTKGRLYLNNSVINENLALTGEGTGDGGAAYVQGDYGKVFLQFCTVYRNVAQRIGGGFYVDGKSLPSGGATLVTAEVSVRNSIVWNNVDGTTLKSWANGNPRRPGYVHADYSDLGYDGIAIDLEVWLGSGTGNIVVRPGLQRSGPQPGAIEYVLGLSAAVRNRAENLAVFRNMMADPQGRPSLPWCKDIAGGRRLVGNRPDMGAYEVQDPPPTDPDYCTYG